jgi:hypothetical protein
MRKSLLLTLCLLAVISLAGAPLTSFSAMTSPDLVIETFTTVPDCIFPDAHRGILSYRVSGDVTYVAISALHRGGRVRPFHSQSSRSPAPSLAATNVIDPGAATDVEGYRLIARSGVGREVGREVSRDLPFRYRVAEFALRSAARHLRDTTGSAHYTRYEADANAVRVDSLTCSFRFDAPIAGESGRTGSARIVSVSGGTNVLCEINWRDIRKARAGGSVEWVARVTDPCTQGRITRRARVNPIP